MSGNLRIFYGRDKNSEKLRPFIWAYQMSRFETGLSRFKDRSQTICQFVSVWYVVCVPFSFFFEKLRKDSARYQYLKLLIRKVKDVKEKTNFVEYSVNTYDQYQFDSFY